MDVGKAISAYIERIITDVQGMKVLLLDAETVRTPDFIPSARFCACLRSERLSLSDSFVFLPHSPAALPHAALTAGQTPIISTSFTQSSLLAHEVYLTDRVDNSNRDRMRHLKCVALVRPSAESVQALVEELREPRYGGYWLCEWSEARGARGREDSDLFGVLRSSESPARRL